MIVHVFEHGSGNMLQSIVQHQTLVYRYIHFYECLDSGLNVDLPKLKLVLELCQLMPGPK